MADACLEIIPKAPSGQMLDGVGLFGELLHLADGSMMLGYYDRVLGNVHIAQNTGSSFTSVGTFAHPSLDTGMWLSMVAGTDNTLHLAFQDASADLLMYTTFSNGALSVPEIVDDGVRDGENRAHPVGASAAIILHGDRDPVIVYQDGLTADVEVATNEQGSWTRNTIMESPRLDGFFIDVAGSDGALWMSHYFYDRAAPPMGELEIITLD
ncbi:MAG: hypothetical protein GY811_00730 [Myxococcales bacterium]|nr:hypothetical protein [Myxococcales bacterium]